MKTQTVKLGEVLDVQNGFAFKTEFFSESDGVPLIRIRDLGNPTTEAHYTGEYRAEFLVEPDDYLIGMDGNFRCRRWEGPKALLNQRVCRLRNFSHRVLPEYVFYGIQRQLDAIEATTSFATVKHISARQISNIELPVPPLKEQRRIVDLLSRAEGIVRLRREAQKKAAEIIPALFLDMFGDPATNPKGWPTAPLNTVAEVISGVAKGRRLSPEESIELPYMRVANVKDGHLDLSEVKRIAIKRTEVDRLLILPGDLLMTEGGDPDKLGRAALWRGEIEGCVHQNHIFKVRSDRDCLVPEYLRSLAGSAYGKAYFLSVAKKTTGIASINKTQLSAFPVVLPPLEAQAEFRDRIASLETIASQQVAAISKAEEVFVALLARTITVGEQPSAQSETMEAVA
jgi:type I restriction enzyme S subunit